MKERLQAIKDLHKWTILESVINEIIDNEKPADLLRQIIESPIYNLNFPIISKEENCNIFYNQHKTEIENIIQYIEHRWKKIIIPEWYSKIRYISKLTFQDIAFDLFIDIVVEEIL